MKAKNILESVRCVVISRARSAHMGGITGFKEIEL